MQEAGYRLKDLPPRLSELDLRVPRVLRRLMTCGLMFMERALLMCGDLTALRHCFGFALSFGFNCLQEATKSSFYLYNYGFIPVAFSFHGP